MTYLRLSGLLLTVSLTACTTPQAPVAADRPAPTIGSVASSGSNPLIGTWKFDGASSVVHTVTMLANKGAAGQNSDNTKKMVEMSEGSTVTFTEKELTVRIADGRSISTEYSIQSRDGNGNYVVVDSKGNPSSYAIAGSKLINPAPEVNFVSVYVKQ